MPFEEYDRYDAAGLAELVRRREVTPAELCETAISRIEDQNPRLNAVITPMFDLARARAAGPLSGPFAGVPFLLKDLLAAYAGVRLASGCRAYRDYVPDYDSELVRRFKAAGVVVIGKTSTPEFGLVAATEPELFGPTRNPWDPERTPGGSSGGSAAAVASGMVPFASGGDGGGSIRIPSSFCGLFGLKPTRFRTPTGPRLGRIWQGAAVEHVLTRSVRDSAIMLDATSGQDHGAPFAAPLPERTFAEEVGRDPGKLRIAFTTASPIGTPVHPENKAAVENAAKLLAGLGHEVVEAQPDLDGAALARSFFLLYFGECAADVAAVKKDIGRTPRRDEFELITWFFGRLGRLYSAGDLVEGIRLWDQAARTMGEFHRKYDLFMTPTVAEPPLKIGETGPKPMERKLLGVISALGLERVAKWTGAINDIALQTLAHYPFTQLANYTGQPAMSVPLGSHASGLPIGVQFVAPFGDEATLFRLAAQLEKERPWFDRRP